MKCGIGWMSENADREATLTWLASVGMDIPFLSDDTHFEIELIEMPDILATFARLESKVTVSRISPSGVTFYLTDIPFTLDTAATEGREAMIEPENADGWLFVPMSNVRCINGFGGIRRVDVRRHKG